MRLPSARRPLLLQDYHLIEKLAQFNRERVPDQQRMLCRFFRADPGYGAGIARGVGIEVEPGALDKAA